MAEEETKRKSLLANLFSKSKEDEDEESGGGSGSFEDNKNKKNTELKTEDEDDDQRFIRKDQPQEEMSEAEEKLAEGVIEVVNKLEGTKSILPESNQQRNLDRETGGLESEEKKETSSQDFWDERSEEVDRMGSVNAFQKGSIKSMIWRYKKKKLDEKKEMLKDAAAAGAAIASKGGKSQENQNSLGFEGQGYIQRLKNLRQDRSDGFSNDRGGGRGM